MPSIFASPDIAALVAAFPPPEPTKNDASLVRSLSGNNLLNSQTLLAQLRRLLETESKRIRCSDLGSRFGIEKTEWLFDCYDGPVNYSRDGQSMIPDPEFEKIKETLRSRLSDQFVELSSFAAEVDISSRSLDPQIESLRRFSDAGSITVATENVVRATTDQLRSIFAESSSEKRDLRAAFPDVPRAALLELAREALDSTAGELEQNGGALVFVPSAYGTAQEEKRRAETESTVQTILKALENDGFCELPADIDAEDIRSRYTTQHGESEPPVILSPDTNPKALVLQPLLTRTLDELKTALITYTNARPLEEPTTLPRDLPKPTTTTTNLPTHLIQTPHYLTHLKQTWRAQNHSRTTNLIHQHLLAPTILHSASLTTAADPPLQKNLDAHLRTHFHQETLPAFLRAARDHNFHPPQTEKLAAATARAKTFPELHAYVVKFGRKQGMAELPSRQQLRGVKVKILRQRVRGMGRMERGSDVLQNLVWVLLSREAQRKEREAVFLSAGRDTSRMVRLLRAMVGEEEEGVVERVEGWRDRLKAGEVFSGEEMAEMRALAEGAVREMGEDEAVA